MTRLISAERRDRAGLVNALWAVSLIAGLVFISGPATARDQKHGESPNLLTVLRGLFTGQNASSGKTPRNAVVVERPAKSKPAPKSAPARIGCSGELVKSAYYSSGRRTANGEPFNPHGMTAAHRTLPFGTRLTVTNPRTGQSAVVRVNDRGPFVRGLSLDLSLGAAKAIGMRGTEHVCIS
jgi:rare lipoprotein A